MNKNDTHGITEFLATTLNNPWIVSFGYIIGIAGIIVTILIYAKSRKIKKAYYNILSSNIFLDITAQYPDLEISFSGEAVKTLSISKILLYNAGTQTLNSSDIAEAEPIEIRGSEDVRILHTELTTVDNKANNIRINNDDESKRIIISFDYIDPGEGAVFTVVHTGAKTDDIYLRGSIKGFGKLKQKKISSLDAGSYTGFFAMFAYFMLSLTYIGFKSENDNEWLVLSLITFFFLATFCAYKIFKIMARRTANTLRKFEEGISV